MDVPLNIKNGMFRSIDYYETLMMLEPHTVLFLALTGVGKTHLTLDLHERAYFNHLTMLLFSALPCDLMLHPGVESGFGPILMLFR